MKVVIFAGGMGTRISEESHLRPKPMIEIGGKPLLWHIMKIYEANGFTDFIICMGYRGYIIKEYFINYFYHNSDLTVELRKNKIEVHNNNDIESFKVTLVETGYSTGTAGRLQQIQKYIGNEDFMLTYGDGVADININDLVAYHHSHKKLATMTAIIPEGRFGTMDIDDNNIVKDFKEKPKDDKHWINGGFFVLKPQVFDYLRGDMAEIMWEQEPMQALTKNGQLVTYKHTGFWKCMDALRDKTELEEMWNSNNAKWKVW
jgi:glucose-1-phosphate cytidylyltransferase